MRKVLGLLVAGFVFGLMSLATLAANYVYLVDTSGSMIRHRPLVLDAVSRDIERALSSEPSVFRAGDRVCVWACNADVGERLKVTFDPNSKNKIRTQIDSQFKRMKWGGTTSLGVALLRILEEFQPAELGNLNLLLYSDGRDSVSLRYSDPIQRIYNHSFRTEGRLSNFYLLQFGEITVPDSLKTLCASLGGHIVNFSHSPDLAPAQAPAALIPPTISVTPASIQVVAEWAPEIVKAVPIDFQINPPQSGISVGISLQATNLPDGMTWGTTTDHLATEGKQAVSFSVRNPKAGFYRATLKLASAARIEPNELPVQLEVRAIPPAPVAKIDSIGVQFLPDPVPRAELPASAEWRLIPNLSLSLFFPDNLNETTVQIDGVIPEGIELQIAPGGNPPEAPLPLGRPVKLATLGHSTRFQIRRTASSVVGKDLIAKLSFHVSPEQKIKMEGAPETAIPFQFVAPATPLEVAVESRELKLGDIRPNAKSVQAILKLSVRGTPTGHKLAITKLGKGLDGISILPAEIVLKTGDMAVELEFSGFANRATGEIHGSFGLVPAPGSISIKAPPEPVLVHGRVLAPSKLIVELANPMVAGQPLVIRAHLESGGKAEFRAMVRPPDSGRDHEVVLADNGSPDAGDARTDDGVYSGVFKQTETLGQYQVTVSIAGATNEPQRVSVPASFYFKAPPQPLVGQLDPRQQTEFLNLKTKVFSTYPGGVAIRAEPTTNRVPLNTYFSNRTLETGENTVDILVGLTSDSRAATYKYNIELKTQPIDGADATIPLALEVEVLSPFHHFVRLVVLALLLACTVFLAIAIPWRKRGLSFGGRRSGRASHAMLNR